MASKAMSNNDMSLNYQGALDTNALLRLLLNDLPKQCDAVKNLLAEAAGPYHVNPLVLAEVVFILQGKGYSRSDIAQNLKVLAGISLLYFDRSAFLPSLELYQKYPALSFVDCYSLCEAQSNDALPLYTFDKDLIKKSAGKAKGLKT